MHSMFIAHIRKERLLPKHSACADSLPATAVLCRSSRGSRCRKVTKQSRFSYSGGRTQFF